MLSALLLGPFYVRAQGAKKSTVAVLVTFSVPSGAGRAQIQQGMANTAPTDKSAPGLIREYFIVAGDERLGGIYLWKDRKSAEAWYKEHPVWRGVVPKNTDPHASLTYFDVPIVTNGPVDPERARNGNPVVVVVRVPDPPGVDREKIEEGMAKSVPTYETAPGLIRKYFIFTEDQKFGGIYLWDSRKAAEAWYTESVIWHNGVSKITGLRADLTYFEAPMVVDGPQSGSSNHP
jgi:hypothetical protein